MFGLARNVARQREVHRAEARLERRAPRAPDRGGCVHAVERDRLLRERAEHRVQIELLMRRIRRRARRHRRGDGDERRAIEERVRDAEREVQRAGPERRDAHARLALDLAAGVGHECRHGFVADEDEFDADFPRGFDEVQNLAARQAEHPFDTSIAKRRCQNLSTRRHRRLLPVQDQRDVLFGFPQQGEVGHLQQMYVAGRRVLSR